MDIGTSNGLLQKIHSFFKVHDSMYKTATAGAVSGLVAAIMVCPLDVVKVRLQNQTASSVPKYVGGTVSTLKAIWSEEGVRGLYRGLSPAVVSYLPDRAIWFSCYYKFKIFFADSFHCSMDESSVHLAASLSASVVNTLLLNPIWVVRTRIMLQPPHPSPASSLSHHYTSMYDAFSTIIRTEGFSALYKGLGPTLLGVSHAAVQFPVYEKLKQILAEDERHRLRDPQHELSNTGIIIASSVSKMIACIATYPHEVLRTRLQTLHPNDAQPEINKYHGMVQATRLIIAEEGVRGFYKGLSASLVRSVPSAALSIWCYEWLLRVL
ncbi:mitochondrial carrier domain-containing protein [Polychytrium aggregatum]|uniref:mitochondrial carrier domain-containing protein n=1 Tax=Polychytrium aggregatum TaxID=110093 RepID=UPI0022FE5118|nr:mitochondrial carrier domain-containing protein [Polychytrium aggregatum]KAI9208654.1 mitochondrial carrier domain-containing protein [Polychytrium aggregatum]